MKITYKYKRILNKGGINTVVKLNLLVNITKNNLEI